MLAGRIGEEGWPPPWPLSKSATNDEQQVAVLTEQLGLDARGWKRLCAEVWELSSEREVVRLEEAIAQLLVDGHVLDEDTLTHVHRLVKGLDMEHLTKAATVVDAELGQFSAIAAAYSIDRSNEQIRAGAFRRTIARWRASGKGVPLHWNHSGDADAIIGSIHPEAMRETGEGLYVEGSLDLDESATAREAWRSMKRNRVGLSFGFLATRKRKRSDGVTELREIDLFEVSIVPSPANADTRLLALKGAGPSADHSLREELLSIMEAGGRTPDGRRAVPDVVQRADWERLSGSSGRLDSDHDQRRRFATLTGDAKAARPAAQDEPVRVASFGI